MKILFEPLVRIGNENLFYEFSDTGVIKVTDSNGLSDEFDFSGFPEGELSVLDSDGNEILETELSFNPIRKAWKEDEVLYVKLVNFIGHEASEEECFPDWINHTEYIPPKVGEVNGQDEMEE